MRTLLLFFCFSLLFAEETSLHEVLLDSGPISYTATVGNVVARDAVGKETGKIYYTSYVKQDAPPSSRPLTFAFNGGPGSASLWLHLGALGPKRLLTEEEGQTPLPPYRWIDNADSILDLTDLVFIDPIGTGFSRASSDAEEEGLFYGVDEDIEAIGDFIRDYIAQKGRWNSAKYIAGESYGGIRASGVADYLLERYSLYLNGLIFISAAFDYHTLICNLDNELPYALYLPTYAATAWHYGRLSGFSSLEKSVEQARAFALERFAPLLLRHGRVPPSLYSELSAWTGLPLSLIDFHDGLIDEFLFLREFAASEKKALGIYDTRSLGSFLPPRTAENYVDPSAASISGQFSGAMNCYLQEELGCKFDWPRYENSAEGAFARWWKSGSLPNVMQNLRSALVQNPHMRLFAACGYFDLAVPFASVEHSLKRLHLPNASLRFGYYEGGHMFYTNPSALKQFKQDLVQFYREAP